MKGTLVIERDMKYRQGGQDLPVISHRFVFDRKSDVPEGVTEAYCSVIKAITDMLDLQRASWALSTGRQLYLWWIRRPEISRNGDTWYVDADYALEWVKHRG